MKTQQSQRLLVAIAITAASFLVSVPTHAKPAPNSPTNSGTTQTPPATARTIVDIAAANPNLKTLVAAVKAADLVEPLSAPGPFTVFAPTDAAFAALPKGTLEKLLKPENKATLQKILTYHVVSGAVDSKTLKSGQIKSLEGGNITVRVRKAGVRINNATVTKADIKASNGVIHVINQVILPPGFKL